MKILNLYAGIGGNRKLWGNEHEITAVENNREIAMIYAGFFPNDEVVFEDAHQYLLNHYQEFDFIWSSPPCPTHSRFNLLSNEQEGKSVKYPDMTLYQEIIYLKHWFKGKWVVENVISYYEPLIQPIQSNNHYFWTNFLIPSFDNQTRGIRNEKNHVEIRAAELGFDLSKLTGNSEFKRKILNNCTEPELARRILEYAINPIKLQKELNF